MRITSALVAILILLVSLIACGDGNIDNVKIADWKPSEIYTDSEINSAIETVKRYFKQEFSGCTLTRIGYVGDDSSEEFNEWATQYNADEAIVLYSTFNVDSSGGDGSLDPNSTYDNWEWILVRNDKENWIHAGHGY